MRRQLAFVTKIRWWWLVGIIPLAMVGSCLIFPAKNGLSAKEILQSDSNARLGAFAKWTVARGDSEEELRASIMFSLTRKERSHLLNALQDRDAYRNGNFDLSSNELQMDVFSNYVVAAREKRSRVEMPDGRVAFVIAHEKPGEWDDGTVAVYLMNWGVVRMANSDFQAMTTQNGKRLQYSTKTHLWTFDTGF